MNRKTRALGLLMAVTAAASLVAACSGDDGDKGTGSGGSSTSAGTGGSKAGSASSGSSSGGNDSGGKSSNGGSNNNAGTNNNGGSNGNTGGFNFGGAGIDELMCDPVPQNGSACEMDEACFEGTTVCGCVEGEWNCVDLGGGEGGGPGGGFGDLECPATQPTSGGACDALGFCPYGGQNMGCACDGAMWACTN